MQLSQTDYMGSWISSIVVLVCVKESKMSMDYDKNSAKSRVFQGLEMIERKSHLQHIIRHQLH